MGESLRARTEARLDAIRDAGLLRTLRPPSGIDLSSNDYLGLARDPRVRSAMAEAVAREGCGSTGSRLLRGDRPAFAAVEQKFAAFKGSARALYFSSGYLANLGIITALVEPGDVVLSDERNHASLIDGIRLSGAERVIYRHNDAGAVAKVLAEYRGRQIFVVTESLFSMDGDLAPLAKLSSLCRTHGAALVVDEAHAVGVYGATGSGLIEATGLMHDEAVCASVNTAGKALGAAGAFVCGPAWVVEALIQRARPFIFSTAPPPAIAAAIDVAIDIVAHDPSRRATLAARAGYLRDKLTKAGIAVLPGGSAIVPVVIGDNERTMAVAAVLQDHGFDVRAIRPPSVPVGTSRLRVSVNAALDEQALDRFVEILAHALEESHAWSAVSS